MSWNLLLYLRKNGFLLLIILLSASFFILALLSRLSYGGADDIVHYRFAKYSFKHLELLLDHWAKPVFTLLASPFAQLGYWGVKLFNIIVGGFTGYFVFRISGILNMKRSQLVIILLFFTPVYTTMLMSGMTEILFGGILTLAAYLFLEKKYMWSAIIISFLPLVRTEGIIIWPLYVIGLFLHRQWKAVPFILSASIIYTIIGGLYFKDFLWLITHVPYTGTYDIYGHGELLHFVNSNKVIFGLPLTLLFVVGIFSYFIKKPSEIFKESKFQYRDEIIVILAPLLVYYCAHSYVWWKGMNSMGLIRVMAGVAPLFALFSLRGLNLILDLVPVRSLQGIILFILITFISITPFKVYEIPLKLSDKDQLVKKAAEWYNTSPYSNRKFYVWESFFYFVSDTNPYDPQKMADGIPDRQNPENLIKPGEIVIWDAHFSAVDGRFPLTAIIDNPYFKLIKVFRPQKPFDAGGGTYQLCFFERLDSSMRFNNRRILDSLSLVKPAFKEVTLLKRSFIEQAHPDGLMISRKQEYYLFKEIPAVKQDWNAGDELNIRLTSRGKPMVLAISAGNNRKLSFYKSYIFNNSDSTTTNEFKVQLPELKKQQKLKIYIWNQDNNEASIHGIEIKLLKQ